MIKHTHTHTNKHTHTHNVKNRTETLVVVSKEIYQEVNAEKSKYMVMSRDQNVGQIQNIKIGNKSFQRMEQFRFLETTLKNV
jgi:hypothetical protein